MVFLWIPKTFWLSLTNILLAAAVIACILVFVTGLLCGSVWALRRRKSYRAELEHDMEEFFGVPHPPTRTGIRRQFLAFIRQAVAPLKRWRPFHRHG